MRKIFFALLLFIAQKAFQQQASITRIPSAGSLDDLNAGLVDTTNSPLLNGLPPDDSSKQKDWSARVSGEPLLTGDHVPFWMRSRQYGSLPLSGASLSLIANFEKNYKPNHNGLVDWGAGLEIRTNLGNYFKAIVPEAYLKGRLWYFELKAGRGKETMGITGDTSLTSGSFAISGNALGIPNIELSIPEYAPVFGGKLFTFKGNFVYGWMGKGATNDRTATYNGEIYFHQKSIYGRIGKPSWKTKLYGGINHHAIWGWDRQYFGSRYDLSDLQAFGYVILGKVYKGSKLGNQLGSVDVGMSYDWKNIQVMGYHQFIYDVGALFHLANLRDGLTGVCFTNKKTNTPSVKWNKLLFEVLYTKNQAGELWSKPTPSGDENYYNNWGTGWAYKGLGLGTPFITPNYTTRKDLPNDPADYFINNRVLLFHTGMEATVKQWLLTGKLSYSKNYGTFGTSPAGHSLGSRHTPPRYGLFGEVDQFSAYFDGRRELKDGYSVGAVFAFDIGKLFYNTAGFGLAVSKRFN